MLPTASDLIYFLEISNTLNLSRAAERLGISQPSLSLAVKRLEQLLGANLLVRHKRGVHLTQAGKQLLKHARQLLQQWEEMKAETLASQKQIQGYFTLGCHSSIAKYMLPHCLPEIVRNYPKIELHLKHDISRRITEEVISLNLDLAIVVNPVRHPDLVIVKLFNDQVTVWENHKLLKKVKSPPIICDPELPQPQTIIKQYKTRRLTFDRMITSSSLDVIATLTAHGCGYGILPERVVKSTYPELLTAVGNAPLCKDEISIIYRHENRNVMAIQTIITAIKKQANL